MEKEIKVIQEENERQIPILRENVIMGGSSDILYDASYLFEENPITNEHYTELVNAITNKARIYLSVNTGNFDALGRIYDEETGDIVITITVGTAESFDGTDYAVDNIEVFEIDGTTKAVTATTAATNGADIAYEIDKLNTNKLDTSKVKTTTSTTPGDVYDVTYINSNMGGSYTAGTNIEITNENVINNTIPFTEEGNKVLLGTGTSGNSSSTVVGVNATSTGRYSVAYGPNAQATQTGTIAIGYQARASLEGSMAFGRGASAEKQNQVVFGGNTPVTEIAIGYPYNYKPLATQEYVNNIVGNIETLLSQI